MILFGGFKNSISLSSGDILSHLRPQAGLRIVLVSGSCFNIGIFGCGGGASEGWRDLYVHVGV